MENTATVAVKADTGVVRSRARLTVLALITVGTMINYLDRAVLGVAAPSMTRELGLDAVVMGIVFSAFSWTYAAAQIPGGAFVDRVGARLSYFWSVTLWSVFTLLQGLASGLISLLTFRLGLGVAEAPCYPTNSRVLSTWFPQHERARATGVYSVGQYFGLAFLSPLLFWIVAELGWPSLDSAADWRRVSRAYVATLAIGLAPVLLIALAQTAVAPLLGLSMVGVLLLVLGTRWVAWRRTAYALDGDRLLIRTGWWRRRLLVLPLARIQSVDLTQSFVGRWFGIASLMFGVAGGGGFAAQLITALPRNIANELRERLLGAVA